MRVLVVGEGGREHALVWKLAQSPKVTEIYAAPGNPGIAENATCIPIGSADIVELAEFAAKMRIDLTVVGPELPLVLGISDEFSKHDLKLLGPTRLAAEIEGSKVFSKEFMNKHGIPTASARVCCDAAEASKCLEKAKYPLVLKADGLAAGKGVVIANDREQAVAAVATFFSERKFGNAASRILIEEFLEGEEITFMALSDGRRALPLVGSKDYKRVEDGDLGENTGGMGAICPTVVMRAEQSAEIMRSVIIPAISGMEKEGRTYQGVLYAGIMLTASGPRVLEFNCRFGDPEAQVLMLRLESDLVDLLLPAAAGHFPADLKPVWRKEASVSVVLASKGYPGSYEKGKPITGLEAAAGVDGVKIFHCATRLEGDQLVTNGGRVLNVCARASSLADAVARAYDVAGRIAFEGKTYRHDIGASAMRQLAAASPAR